MSDNAPRIDRRGLLLGGGAAAATAAGLTALTAGPAAAAGTNLGYTFTPVVPYRAYDSRFDPRAPGGVRIGAGSTVAVMVSTDLENVVRLPAGITVANLKAVAYNVSVTETAVAGYLTILPGGAQRGFTSTVNWFASGQIMVNAGVSGVGSSQLAAGGSLSPTVECFCGGPSTASTHWFIDICGFYS